MVILTNDLGETDAPRRWDILAIYSISLHSRLFAVRPTRLYVLKLLEVNLDRSREMATSGELVSKVLKPQCR